MIHLGGSPHVLAWGWLQITWANAIVVLLMLALFAAALLLPFPGSGRASGTGGPS